jgi:hypothetical protein
MKDKKAVTGLKTVAILCPCGFELDRVSDNVLGLTTTIKCRSCGRDNEFRHSLQPEADKAAHRFREESPPIHT